MRDPVERMVQFVMGQKQQAAVAHARSLWVLRLPLLVPCARAVVDAFRGGLEESAGPPAVSVLLDPRHDLCPLVIAFERRDYESEGVLPLRPDLPRKEVGASAVFRCEVDGIVYGFRYPFHGPLQDVRPERFVDLGEPATVQPNRLGNAVADFLEWASVGDGCGSRPLRFWAPPGALSVPERPVQLRVITA
jgi:hypothetical protein